MRKREARKLAFGVWERGRAGGFHVSVHEVAAMTTVTSWYTLRTRWVIFGRDREIKLALMYLVVRWQQGPMQHPGTLCA